MLKSEPQIPHLGKYPNSTNILGKEANDNIRTGHSHHSTTMATKIEVSLRTQKASSSQCKEPRVEVPKPPKSIIEELISSIQQKCNRNETLLFLQTRTKLERNQ